jgi:hypothetical protein
MRVGPSPGRRYRKPVPETGTGAEGRGREQGLHRISPHIIDFNQRRYPQIIKART